MNAKSTLMMMKMKTKIIEIYGEKMFKLFHFFNTGPKKGTSEVWVENLPGESDHLIRSADKTRETYWMPIVNARNQSNPSLLDWMSDKPYLRKEILDQYNLIGTRLEQLGQEYGNEQLEKLGFEMKTSFQFYRMNIGNNYGLILELDAQGNILGSLHSPAGVNSFISEALEGESESPLERVLYIGSFGYPYILKLAIRKPAIDIAAQLNAAGTSPTSARAIVALPDSVSATNIAAQSAALLRSGYSAINGTTVPAVLSTWSQIQRQLMPFGIRMVKK